ncbi:aldehyde dehydrogenase [Aquitalea magnusonii]|uniref:Aldehyde dehydrogenase n=1 Tax=Aquitalea magnusonii TaxID=332411 RepID=A0A3G9GAP4_9NEIS|nr:coniferyl aldehyde dehydrogenase [Aquitalea magnusonii]BBF84555.1 aldehyde dehydrogenase [Aquitalea magnusonii]
MKRDDVDFASRSDVGCWLQGIFAAQQAAFEADPCPNARVRRSRLGLLKRQLGRYQDVLVEAMNADFGCRSATESKLFDLLGSTLELNHLISHVGRWMKPSRRSTELLFKSNVLQVIYQPKGVVGIIVPWNFPIYLALGPLAAALAAGNRVMLKMPEAAAKTGRVLARMLEEVFAEDEVVVVFEKLPDYELFTSLPFNHIVFTGSPAVGKAIMRAAADNLIPVTLELGGKSPAVVGGDYPIEDAARRIVHGKTSNAGQICVAPDYALVPRARMDAFITTARQSFATMVGSSYASNRNYTSIINERQFQRLQDMLADARAKGATVIPCAPCDVDDPRRRMPLHIVLNCSADMRVMQEELFGPILPVLGYDSMDEVLRYLSKRPRPLALYCFSHDRQEQNILLAGTRSGGVTINDWGWHVVNHDAPFGGNGNSGMGTYHGIEGFRELSHARTVFKRRRFFPTQLFHPPYASWVQKLTLRYFLGKADPLLK